MIILPQNALAVLTAPDRAQRLILPSMQKARAPFQRVMAPSIGKWANGQIGAGQGSWFFPAEAA
jgi:hypothetical protein